MTEVLLMQVPLKKKIIISSALHNWNLVTILLITLTLWEYEDGELAFVSYVVTQP